MRVLAIPSRAVVDWLDALDRRMDKLDPATQVEHLSIIKKNLGEMRAEPIKWFASSQDIAVLSAEIDERLFKARADDAASMQPLGDVAAEIVGDLQISSSKCLN